MRVSREFTIELTDGPRGLGDVIDPMAQAGINIEAMTLLDAPPHMILRLVVDKPDDAAMIFERLDRRVTCTRILAADLSHEPGALADILRRLADRHIDVNYAYVSATPGGAHTTGIIHVDDPAAALKALADE